MDQKEIIEKIRGNKLHKVYGQLQKTYPSIKKWILSNNGTKQDAEDVFQETLIVFCINCRKPDFQLSYSISTYLTAIAKNIWFSILRKRDKVVAIPEESDTTTDFEMIEERYNLAQQAFNLLGEKCKLLLEKFYVLKLSFEEIKHELGFSTVEIAKNQKYRCLQKAKEIYVSLTEKGGEAC